MLFQASMSQDKLPLEGSSYSSYSQGRSARTLSLMCILCKCLGKLTGSYVMNYSLLSKVEHGFVKGRSYLSNLPMSSDEVIVRLD